MDIVSALKTEASKLQRQLDTLNSAIETLGGKNSVGRPNGRKRNRHFSAASKAKMAASQSEVGKDKSHEEEYLTPPFVPPKVRREAIWSVG